MRLLPIFLSMAVSTAWGADAPKNASSAQPFEVSVTVTEKGNEFFNSWDRPTGKRFNLEALKVAPRGKFLSALVLFKGCKPDPSGNCDAVMDIVAYDPRGKIYGEMPRVELWRQKPAPDAGYSQLSRSYMGLVIEPNDPSGTYRINVIARDLNARTEARSEARFEVK